jgi:hypothetical protein
MWLPRAPRRVAARAAFELLQRLSSLKPAQLHSLSPAPPGASMMAASPGHWLGPSTVVRCRLLTHELLRNAPVLSCPATGAACRFPGLAPTCASARDAPPWEAQAGESLVPVSPQIGPPPLLHALDAAAPPSRATPRRGFDRPLPPLPWRHGRAPPVFTVGHQPNWLLSRLVEAHREQCCFLISIRFNLNSSNKVQNRLKFVSIQINLIKYSNQMHYLKLNLISEINV